MATKPKPAPAKREVTDEVVKRAIAIRSSGGKWSAVEEATGFNGATLRPHMAKAGFKPQQANVAVKLTPASIAAARKKGMPWYAIALALDAPEAKVRSLAAEADPSSLQRTYLKADKPAPKPKAKPAAKKPAPHAKARSNS